MLEDGKGIPKDEVEALKWYRKAAEQGYAPAQNILGVTYTTGHGVPNDDVEAVKWYRKAAEQGMRQRKQIWAVAIPQVEACQRTILKG